MPAESVYNHTELGLQRGDVSPWQVKIFVYRWIQICGIPVGPVSLCYREMQIDGLSGQIRIQVCNNSFIISSYYLT